MVKISDDELIEALKDCYENEGIVNGPTLNDTSNEYPTQPTYSYRFDGGLREACDIAGVPYGKREKWDKTSIVEAAESHFKQNNTFGVSDFTKYDDLPPTSVMYDHFDSINDLIDATSMSNEIRKRKSEIKEIASQRNANNSKKYNESDKDALENHLWWVMKEYGDTKTSTVDTAPGPSSGVYSRIYGSIGQAREAAGIDVLYRENFTDRIGELPESYDSDADGYVYVLKMVREGISYFYVGMSQRLKKRLNTHSLQSSKVMLHQENKYDTMKALDLHPVCIVRIENYYKDDESDDEFRDRLKSEEHIISHQVSAAFNTDKILGGRS